MFETVLVILTLADPGPPHVSFSKADDPEDCAAKAEVVTQILTGAGYTILGQACAETALNISPYDHGATEFPYHWRVTLADPPMIEPAPAPEKCVASEAERVFCAVSAQSAQ